MSKDKKTATLVKQKSKAAADRVEKAFFTFSAAITNIYKVIQSFKIAVTNYLKETNVEPFNEVTTRYIQTSFRMKTVDIKKKVSHKADHRAQGVNL